MDNIRLPRHVIDRLENRWAGRLKQEAKTWSSGGNRPVQARHFQTDAARVIPVMLKRARGPKKRQYCEPFRALDQPGLTRRRTVWLGLPA
jgi:hypothetical protein